MSDTDDMCPNCVTPWKCNGPHNEERTPLIEAIQQSLQRLDGSTLAAVALITGLSISEIDALGGLDDA